LVGARAGTTLLGLLKVEVQHAEFSGDVNHSPTVARLIVNLEISEH